MRFLRLLTCLCLAFWNFAQDVPLRVQRLSLEDGLSQSSVFCAIEDHLGFLWFGTANGLNRYDGYGFKTFTHEPRDAHSLSNDWIFTVCEDNEGNIWVGHRNGVDRMERGSEAFSHYLQVSITKLLCDSRGGIWAGGNEGLWYMPKDAKSFQPIAQYAQDDLFIMHPRITALTETDGLIWVGTVGGLVRFDLDRRHTQIFVRVPYPLVMEYGHSLQEFCEIADMKKLIHLDGAGAINKPFVLDKPQRIAVLGVGEGLGEWFDWGRLVREDGSVAWQMDLKQSRYAGGHGKNRVQLDLLDLPAGAYQLVWSQDDSHHVGSYNRAPPDAQWLPQWGLSLWAMDASKGSDLVAALALTQVPEQIPANYISCLYPDPLSDRLWVGTQGNGAFSISRDGSKIDSLYGPSSGFRTRYSVPVMQRLQELKQQRRPLVEMPLSEPSQQLRDNFELSETTQVLIVAHGEGITQLGDTARITQGKRSVWSMQAHQTRHAGGALKNRLQMTAVELPAGQYQAFVESDENHDPSAWNAEPANIFYGLRLFVLSGHELEEWQRLTQTISSEPELASPVVRSFARDSSGRLWIGTSLGVSVIDGKRVSHHMHNPSDPKSLNSDDVQAMVCDRAGNMWIGTVLGGINKLTQLKSTFHTVTPTQADMPTPLVYSFADRPDGSIWIGSNRGLSLYDPKQFAFIPLDWPCEKGPCIEQRVAALLEPFDDYLLVGSQNGFFQLDVSEQGSRRQITNVLPIKLSQRESGYVVSCLLATENHIYAGTLGLGLHRRTRDDDTWHRILPEVNFVSAIAVGNSNDLWIGTSRHGVVHVKGSGQIQTITTAEGLSGDIISCLASDELGVWVGTYGAGLNFIDHESHQIKVITAQDGLANNVVYGLIVDSGYLWMSTNRGLSRLHKDQQQWVHYQVTDGLQSNEFNTGAYHRLRSGSLIFGGISGFTFFDPAKIKRNDVPPRTVLTALSVGGKPWSNLQPLENVSEIKIPYKDNFLGIEFAAMDFTNTALNQFKFRMSGPSSDWQETGTRRFASFSHLAPGDYRLDVTSCNSDGVWDVHGRHLTIKILPPFWATWWFRLAVVLTLLAFILLWLRHRFSRLKQEQLMRDEFSRDLITSRERERRRLAIELHDGLGQSLTAIRTELIGFLAKRPDAQAELGDLPEYVLQSIDETRTISHQLHPHILDRLGFEQAVQAVVKTSQHASRTEIACDLSNWAPQPKELEIHLYRIVQESLNNIIRHAGAKNAKVKSFRSDSDLVLEVTDDGCGFDPAAVERGLGLTGMAERTRLLGGQFTLESSIDNGTRIRIKIKNEVGDIPRHRSELSDES